MVITLRVRNPGDHAIDVYMRGRSPTFDVIISREDGTKVWHLLQNEIIPAIALVRTLAPAEQFEVSAEWDGHDSLGIQSLRATTSREVCFSSKENLCKRRQWPSRWKLRDIKTTSLVMKQALSRSPTANKLKRVQRNLIQR